MTCSHEPPFVDAGPIVPLRWGSAKSEVCRWCSAYRLMTHHDDPRGDWQAGPLVIYEPEI